MSLWSKFVALLRRKKLEADMAEEMRAHLELQAAENEKRGLSATEARYAAQRSFGGVEQIKERAREERVRGFVWLEQLAQDARHAARGLAKARGFTAVAVLTLGLGIGVNTSLFSVVYGVLLEPFPYARAGEIWAPELRANDTGRQWSLRVGDYLEMAKLPTVESAMATATGTAVLAGGTNPQLIDVARVTGTAFEFLGVAPALGRGFNGLDFNASGEPLPVAVLSFKFWQRHCNGERDVLGRTLILDDRPHTIVGVMPLRFAWHNADAWLPLATTDLRAGARPIVRLKPGASPAVAGEQWFATVRAMAAQSPGPYPKNGFTARFVNYLDVTVASGEMRRSLQLLIGAVGFLLLIACMNVANLQLARAAVRGRELAVRRAIGASRGRIVRQLLVESLGLALLGGALGVLLAVWLTQLIVALMPESYVPAEAQVALNGWVLLFSAAISLVTGVLFGLAPCLQSTRMNLTDALKDGGHGASASRAANRTRSVLVVGEISLAIVLLVGASLAIRGFVQLQGVERGFHAERMLIIPVPLAPKRYATFEQRMAFAREFLARLRQLPGVGSVTLGALPGGEAGSGVTIAGQPKVQDGVALNFVDRDYLPTLGIVLRDGRSFTEDEVAHHDRVAVITESAAKLWADGRSPIGRSLAIDSLGGNSLNTLAAPGATKDVTVIGVVADLRSNDRRRPAPPMVLVPYTLRAPLNRPFLLRAHGDPKALINAVRAELRAMDPAQPMLNPIVVEDYLQQQVKQPRFNLVLFAALAGAALALAAAGIYSVLSYHVAQRTREIGVRMALGAARADILRLVMGAGGRLLLAGLAIGLGVSAGLSQLVRSEVFNVPALDPIALGLAALTLGAVAMLACWWPARRATQVDPMTALRAE